MAIALNTLMEEVKCFACAAGSTSQLIIMALLQRIAEANCSTFENLSGEDSPLNNVTPDFIDQVYVQDDGTIWQAGSLLSSSWTEICSPGGEQLGLIVGPTPETLASITATAATLNALFGGGKTEFTFNQPTHVTGDIHISNNTLITALSFNLLEDVGGEIDISSLSNLAAISFPALVSVVSNFTADDLAITEASFPVLETVGADLAFNDCSDLESFNCPVLTAIGGNLYLGSCPLLTSAPFPLLETIGDALDFAFNSSLTAIDFTSLVTCGNYVSFDSCSALTAISLPLLTIIPSDATFAACTSATTLSLPSLVTVSNGFNATGCSSLTTVDVSSWLPTDGQSITFDGCALLAASVNHILARCVASAGYVSGTVDLSGGTNAAPTGQGVADVVTLTGRGVTVTTN